MLYNLEQFHIDHNQNNNQLYINDNQLGTSDTDDTGNKESKIPGFGMKIQISQSWIRKMRNILMKKNQIWDYKELGLKRKQYHKRHIRR